MRVIVISGHAGSGKDTFAKLLRSHLEERGNYVLTIHFADLLKFMCEKFYDWDGEKDLYGRNLLQHVGTDIVRKKKPDFWVEFVADVLDFFLEEWDYVLIPDARFPNEIEFLKKRGYSVTHIRVNRDEPSGLTESQRNHESETALDGVIADSVIDNNGTLGELEQSVINWIGDRNYGSGK